MENYCSQFWKLGVCGHEASMAGECSLQGQILWLYPLTAEGAGVLSGASFERARELSGASFDCPVAQSCPTLFDPMDCSSPGFPVLHLLPEFAQTHVH